MPTAVVPPLLAPSPAAVTRAGARPPLFEPPPLPLAGGAQLSPLGREYHEVGTGSGIWVVKEPHHNGIAVSCSNGSAYTAHAVLDFAESTNAVVTPAAGCASANGGNAVQVALPPGSAACVAELAPQRLGSPILCKVETQCELYPPTGAPGLSAPPGDPWQLLQPSFGWAPAPDRLSAADALSSAGGASLEDTASADLAETDEITEWLCMRRAERSGTPQTSVPRPRPGTSPRRPQRAASPPPPPRGAGRPGGPRAPPRQYPAATQPDVPLHRRPAVEDMLAQLRSEKERELRALLSSVRSAACSGAPPAAPPPDTPPPVPPPSSPPPSSPPPAGAPLPAAPGAAPAAAAEGPGAADCPSEGRREVAPGGGVWVAYRKGPCGCWDFSVDNTTSEPVVVTVDFSGCVNATAEPLGKAAERTAPGSAALSGRLGPHSSADWARVCPADPSRGWSWGYRAVAARGGSVSDPPTATAAQPLCDGVTLLLRQYRTAGGTRLHCTVDNTRRRAVEVTVSFRERGAPPPAGQRGQVFALPGAAAVCSDPLLQTARRSVPAGASLPLCVCVSENPDYCPHIEHAVRELPATVSPASPPRRQMWSPQRLAAANPSEIALSRLSPAERRPPLTHQRSVSAEAYLQLRQSGEVVAQPRRPLAYTSAKYSVLEAAASDEGQEAPWEPLGEDSAVGSSSETEAATPPGRVRVALPRLSVPAHAGRV